MPTSVYRTGILYLVEDFWILLEGRLDVSTSRTKRIVFLKSNVNNASL